jgi:nicotinamide mononucleotide (NMN) deamidase PncC
MGELMPELLSELLGVDPAEVEAAMAITGMTPEAIAEKLMEQIQLDGAIDSIAAKASTGTYRYEDGKLWLTPDGQTENAEAYETVVLSREGLRITETRSGLFQKYEKILPLTFKR